MGNEPNLKEAVMEQNPQPAQALLLALVSIKKDISDLKDRLDAKTPVLSTEEAVDGFRAYLLENARPNTRRSFDYLLGEFEKGFMGQNVPGIAPIRLQEFLASRWGKGKRSVLRQTLSKLKWFYTWCIKYVQVKGMPPFLNPCDLIEVKIESPPQRPEFIPIEKMREFLATMVDETHWLATAILMTAGLRISELIGDNRGGKPGLLRKDVNGRALTIHNPKSGRREEVAVIPGWVAERLAQRLNNLGPGDKVFPVSYSTVYDVILTHAAWVGLDLRPHYLRKWAASFWSRHHEHALANFILRHSQTKINDATLITTLGARYIAPLSVEEVMEKQDRLMGAELFREVTPCGY